MVQPAQITTLQRHALPDTTKCEATWRNVLVYCREPYEREHGIHASAITSDVHTQIFHICLQEVHLRLKHLAL